MSVVGRTELRGCMGELAPATTLVKDICCDFGKQQHKLSLPVHEIPAMRWPAVLVPTGPTGSAPRWFTADASPPQLGGRGLLTFVCTLVV